MFFRLHRCPSNWLNLGCRDSLFHHVLVPRPGSRTLPPTTLAGAWQVLQTLADRSLPPPPRLLSSSILLRWHLPDPRSSLPPRIIYSTQIIRYVRSDMLNLWFIEHRCYLNPIYSQVINKNYQHIRLIHLV